MASIATDIKKNNYQSSLQSKEKEEYKTDLFQLFHKAKKQRERGYKQFNGKTLIDYINLNHSLSMGYVGDIEVDEWQANTSTNLIRNKFVAVLAFLLDQMIQPEVSAQNGKFVDARAVSRDLEEILHENMQKNKYFQKYLDILIEAVGQGTVFVDTGYRRSKRDIKDIESYDPDTSNTKYKKKTIIDYEGLFIKVIPIHEVYLGNMFIKDIADQPFIFRRIRMDYDSAKTIYGNYIDFNKVNRWFGVNNDEDEPDYKILDQADLVNGDVEILIYQSKPYDEMAIIINGVLITDIGQPLPYDHKEYTLAKGIFNPFPDTEFAYGKSLAHEQMFNQEVADNLLNMLLDKTYLSLFKPLATLGREEVTSDIVIPGSITSMKDTEIRPIPGIGDPVTQGEVNVFQLIQSIQEQSTPQQAGNAASPKGDAVTASQVLAQQQDSIRLMGLFGFTIAFLLEDIAHLWLQVMLQFEFSPQINEKKEATYRSFFLSGRQVFKNKTRGVLEVRLSTDIPLAGSPEEQDLLDKTFKEEEQFKKATGETKMIRYVDPEMVRNYELIVKIQANPNPRGSKLLERAQEEQFFSRFLQDPLINQEQVRRGLIELYDKDPDDYLNTAEPQGQQPSQMPPGQGQTESKIDSQIQAPINQQVNQQQPSLSQLINA